jgi:hypothetical protein
MRAGRPEQIYSCASEGFVLQIGEQLFCMIIRAPDADTAASRADRPVTPSPHALMESCGGRKQLCTLRSRSRSFLSSEDDLVAESDYMDLMTK